MKTINTLVDDIYRTLEEGKIDEGKVKEFSEKLSKMLIRRLRHSGSEGSKELRMSNFGTPCSRKLWYSVNAPDKAERLRGQERLKFLYGDILEELLLFLADQSGHTVEGQQDELELAGIKGHRDAVVDGVLVDVKSANSRSFDKFRSHKLGDDDPFGYLDQLNLYLDASASDPKVKVKGEGAFLVIDKEMGHVVLDRYKKQDKDYIKDIESKKQMLSGPVPKRQYMPEVDGKSGNMKLGLQCSYCPYKQECWKNSNGGKGLRTFLYSGGPRYFTHVAREPREDVKEI